MSVHWLNRAVRTRREAAESGEPRFACPYDPAPKLASQTSAQAAQKEQSQQAEMTRS